MTVTLREWKSATYTNTVLHFDISTKATDATGTELASVTRQGEQNLSGSFMNPPAHTEEAVPSEEPYKLDAPIVLD